eukprot:4596692-Amphidinium_carterae.1
MIPGWGRVYSIGVKLTVEKAIAMQRELLAAFSADTFQAQLLAAAKLGRTLLTEYAILVHIGVLACSVARMHLTRARMETTLAVQKDVLPKYGFEAAMLVATLSSTLCGSVASAFLGHLQLVPAHPPNIRNHTPNVQAAAMVQLCGAMGLVVVSALGRTGRGGWRFKKRGHNLHGRETLGKLPQTWKQSGRHS